MEIVLAVAPVVVIGIRVPVSVTRTGEVKPGVEEKPILVGAKREVGWMLIDECAALSASEGSPGSILGVPADELAAASCGVIDPKMGIMLNMPAVELSVAVSITVGDIVGRILNGPAAELVMAEKPPILPLEVPVVGPVVVEVSMNGETEGAASCFALCQFMLGTRMMAVIANTAAKPPNIKQRLVPGRLFLDFEAPIRSFSWI
jgi:hypothetical protein